MYRKEERHDGVVEVGRRRLRRESPENGYHRETRQWGNDLKPVLVEMLYRRYIRDIRRENHK